MFEMENVRISRYGYKAFQIEVRYERTREKTGEKYIEWAAYKYPGNVDAAVRGLLDIVADPDKVLAADVSKFIEYYESAVEKLTKAINEHCG